MKRVFVLPVAIACLSACGGGNEPDESAATEATTETPTAAEEMAEMAPADDSAPPAVDAATANAPGEEMAAEAAMEATATGAVAAAEPPASFAQCKVCHAVEPGKNGVGPSLAGVFGAAAGHEPKFNYSPAMRNSGKVWNEENLHAYLENPRTFIPGNRMSYAGLRDEAKRQEMIDYLKTL